MLQIKVVLLAGICKAKFSVSTHTESVLKINWDLQDSSGWVGGVRSKALKTYGVAKIFAMYFENRS